MQDKILTREDVLKLLAEIALGGDESAKAAQRIRALEAIARIEGFDRVETPDPILPLWMVAREMNKALGIPASMNILNFQERFKDAELLPAIPEQVDNGRESIQGI